jgi:tetratricopeptide (TPR) repeat protein
MIVLRIIPVLVCILLSSGSYAQDKSIIDLFKSNTRKANVQFEKKQYGSAKKYYLKLFRKDSLNPSIKLRLAECNRLLNNTVEAEKWYGQVIDNPSIIQPIHIYHYAEVLMSNGKPEAAKLWFEKYNKLNKEDKRSKRMAVQAGAIKKLFRDSLAYSVRPVNFNTSEADFSTVYYKKGIIFLSSRKYPSMVRNVSASDNTFFLNLYYTEPSVDSSFIKPVRFHKDLNSSLHDGPLTFFDNGKKLIFSKNQKAVEKNGSKKLGLYYAELGRKGKKWKKIQELPFTNKEYNMSHPYYHNLTNTLYFVSDMPGGYGGTDIYRAINIENTWSKPVNMGPVINTEKSEIFPFVGEDTVLYFSSNGHKGLGGLDILSVDLKKKPLEITNPGYPVNSSKDDFAFVTNEAGNEGFFSSNRKNGGLDDDIYAVEINNIKVELIVTDKLKSSGIKNARIGLVNQETNENIKVTATSQKGIYLFNAVPGRKYKLDIQSDGYRPESFEVYSTNPDQNFMRMKCLMDKYNKIFVRGKVVLNGEGAGICRIKIFDPTADTVDVVYSNAKGEFQCEVNTDTVNILVADGQKMMGILLAKPEKKKRKSSSIQYIELALGTLDSVMVNGIFKSSSLMLPGTDLQLILKNELTNREQVLKLNEKGEFSIKLWDTSNYSIFVLKNNKKTFLKTFQPIKMKYLELVE